jgi:hypothetical protein
MLHKVFAALAAAGALVAPLASHAGTLNFDFSFTGAGPGAEPGTVTGEIFGLTDNATSSPTDVVIFSAPDFVGPLPSTPWDIYTVAGHQFGSNGLSDNFTVANGVITGTNFGFFGVGDADTILDLGYGGLNVFGTGSSTGPLLVGDPTDGRFTPAAGGGVPEPAAWALMITGFFGLGAALRRAQRTAFA